MWSWALLAPVRCTALAAGWALEKFFRFTGTEEACCRRMDFMRLQRLFSVLKEKVDYVHHGVSRLWNNQDSDLTNWTTFHWQMKSSIQIHIIQIFIIYQIIQICFKITRNTTGLNSVPPTRRQAWLQARVALMISYTVSSFCRCEGPSTPPCPKANWHFDS